MKKSLFIAALATLALASCSKNEVIELQQDQIKFSAVADNASRGTVVNASNLGSFHVWGWVEQEGTGDPDYETLYINDVIYSGTVVTPGTYTAPYNSPTPYWWPKGDMKFYAINTNREFEGTSASIFNFNSGNSFTFIASSKPADQIDLIYAAKFEATKTETLGLNFRHALSQIVFELGLDETSLPLEVQVKSIKLTNIDNTATFTMPTANTENNLSVDLKTEPSYNDGTWGTWTNNDDNSVSYTLETAATIRNGKFSDSELATTFTGGYVAYGGTDNERWFMIPQKLDDGLDGSSLVVNCDIYAKGENKVKLYSGDLTYNFATDAEWKQGMKYVYKLKFGAALQTIKFSVTVDEYQTAATTGIEL